LVALANQDDALLNYLNDDGTSIEPEFYVPIIPLVLVNSPAGIGTGMYHQIGQCTLNALMCLTHGWLAVRAWYGS
jgi:DNA gyrase/topoisomerase IV subunit A